MEYVILKVNPFGVLYVVTAFLWAVYAMDMSFQAQKKYVSTLSAWNMDYCPAEVWAVLAFIVNLVLCPFAILWAAVFRTND